MRKIAKKYYEEIIDFIGESPVNTTPLFLLENKNCSVFTEKDGDFRNGLLIVPLKEPVDVYLTGKIEPLKLRNFLATLLGVRTLLCAPSFKTCASESGFFRRKVRNLIYSFKILPDEYIREGEEEPAVQKISSKHREDLLILPPDSCFLFNHFRDIHDFLEKGTGYGLLTGNRMVSCAVTSSMSKIYTDISVYTRIPQRQKGYSFKCSQLLIKDIISMKKYPTWTADENHIPSVKLAEKLGMSVVDEIYCFY